MIVDVITSGVQRIAPIVDGPGVNQHEVIDIYTSPSPTHITHYADAELCDIRAFGLASGLVKVMGGITSFAGVVPVPAAPRIFNFFVREPLRGLGFTPDGTSLGVLYQSCLVVVSIIHPDTRHAYYFGQNHTDVFTGITLTDNFAYVTTATSNEILRFSLHGPDFELERVTTIEASIRTLLSEMDEWVSYQPQERTIRYHGRFAQDPIRDVPLPQMVGDVLKIVPTLDKNYVWCITNTELVIAARETLQAAVRPIQIGCTADVLLTLPYQHGIIIAWHDVVTHKLHFNSYEFVLDLGHISNVSNVSVDFQTAPRALALPASPLTRFNARYPLMILQPIRRVHVVFNAHLYPDADADAEDTEDTDDDDDESEADDEEESDDEEDSDDEVVEATFHYPQPPSGLQQIIRRTRDYLPTLSETFRPWTPDEFGRVLSAARLCTGKRIAMLSQQAAMLAYARENHRILADAVRTVVQDFAKFYNGSASMGLFDPCPDGEDSFAPYAEKVHSTRESTMDPDSAEKLILELLQSNSSSTIGDMLGFEALEFKVDTSYQLGVHFKGIEADTVHAVNTGVISTLNCFVTEVQDLIQSIRLQRKLLKCVSREISPSIILEETSCSKRGGDEHSHPAKRLAPDE